MLTILSNRVGDGLLLMVIGMMQSTITSSLFIFSLSNLGTVQVVTLFVVLAAITKRAQIPFSAWLPAAMAAPTPVSTLVHSSTLVTAGVYLLIRLEFSMTVLTSQLILYIGLFTTIMARIAAMYEIDIKKIVALSTLRQLGLIMARVGLNLFSLAFFHLLVHAFFKALLFITVGTIIHRSSDFQDLRKGRIHSNRMLITNIAMISRNLSLIGIPFFSRFYSKDMIIESSLVVTRNMIVVILFLVSMILTVLYSSRFIALTMLSFKTSPIN
jgi:NADH-ubiquinone oxidoreductase chain 5